MAFMSKSERIAASACEGDVFNADGARGNILIDRTGKVRLRRETLILIITLV